MFKVIPVHWGALYLLAASVALPFEAQWQCPQPCHCNPLELEVNCSDVQLSTVPDSLPQDAKLLNLTQNKIKTLVHRQFQASTHLLDLDLNDNILSVIEVEAFLGLHSLLTLHLAHNHLKIIPVGAFTGLPKLRLLDISCNEILVFLDFTFRDLAALRALRAAENHFVFISHQAFSGLSNLQELHLDGGNLTVVPTDALLPLGELRSLHFLQVSLTVLPNYAFQHLGRLKELVLSHCPWLESLSTNSLFGLNLTSLTITHCNLSMVPYVTLHHLVYLVYLDLSFNPITYIHRNLLGDLIRLQEFHLFGGALLHIENGAFKGLSFLKVLNVSKNLLTTLEAGIFHAVDTLEILGLDSNPLACDCRLLWVVRRQPYLNFGGNMPICTTSVQLQGWSFLDFSKDELSGLLACRQPRIRNRKYQVLTVDQGHTVMLLCNAEGDPQPSVTWLNPQLRPLLSIGRIRTISNGSLEVRYAQPQDAGTYLCVASNAAGNDSLRVSLHVRGFPSSKKHFSLKGLFASPAASPEDSTQTLPFDVKTLLIAATIGLLSFFSSVSLCFIFMFLWSKSKGQIKHTATIAYVPRSTMSNSNSGTGNYMETSRFTMKLL